MPALTPMEACMFTEDAEGVVFVVPSWEEGRSPTIFGKARRVYPTTLESDNGSDPPKFHYYDPNGKRIMKKMGYNLQSGKGLNFDKGRRVPLTHFVPKGKPESYYHQTRRGLGYVTPPTEEESGVVHSIPSHSSDSSEWDSDVSVRDIFKSLSVNMISVNHLEEDNSDDVYPQNHGLNTWIISGKCVSSNANLLLKIKLFKSNWVMKYIQNPYL